MQPDRANPKATPIDPEIVRAARAAGHGIVWLAVTVAELVGDSISTDRKGRQKRRKKGEYPSGGRKPPVC